MAVWTSFFEWVLGIDYPRCSISWWKSFNQEAVFLVKWIVCFATVPAVDQILIHY